MGEQVFPVCLVGRWLISVYGRVRPHSPAHVHDYHGYRQMRSLSGLVGVVSAIKNRRRGTHVETKSALF